MVLFGGGEDRGKSKRANTFKTVGELTEMGRRGEPIERICVCMKQACQKSIEMRQRGTKAHLLAP